TCDKRRPQAGRWSPTLSVPIDLKIAMRRRGFAGRVDCRKFQHMSLQQEDDRDLELQRELEQAFQDFLNATDADRVNARLHHMELLRTFTARVIHANGR